MVHNPTIKDIANALGISKSTVSRALADQPDIKKETRSLVIETARKMHYRPNRMAQNLTQSRTKIIGVVVPEFINSFFSRIIIRIQNIFESEGYRVLITQCNESWEAERRNLQLLEESMVEGILISVTEKGRNTDYYNTLIDNGVPVIFFNRSEKEVNTSRVIIDDYKWSFFATEHLIDIRRRLGQPQPRIMYFKGPSYIELSRKRYLGYVDALTKHGISHDPSLVIQSTKIVREEGFDMMLRCIEAGNVPDALLGFNDPLAIGAMRALKYKRISVPERVSVAGFSESQSSLVTVPALTSVAQPLEEMGEAAARLLLEKIEHPDIPARTVMLEASLNVRGSSDPDKVIIF